jgi:hypothetical protein
MNMLLIVFRESLEEEVRGLLKKLDVKAFTELHEVEGAGECGAVFQSFAWPGANSMILTALPEDHLKRVVEGLQAFRDQRVKQQHGAKIPLRVFLLPCELVV